MEKIVGFGEELSEFGVKSRRFGSGRTCGAGGGRGARRGRSQTPQRTAGPGLRKVQEAQAQPPPGSVFGVNPGDFGSLPPGDFGADPGDLGACRGGWQPPHSTASPDVGAPHWAQRHGGDELRVPRNGPKCLKSPQNCLKMPQAPHNHPRATSMGPKCSLFTPKCQILTPKCQILTPKAPQKHPL